MYDIIGDVHGYADVLERLLLKLGYRKRNGAYRHPLGRIAVFLGDLIDRGAKQKETLGIVFSMIDAGSAVSVIGNHEFSAILYGTEGEHGYLREHSHRNTDQHKAFLNVFPFGSRSYRDMLARLKELPVYLDLKDFRCVHACWHQSALDHVAPLLGQSNRLTDDLLIQSGIDGSESCVALELLLKGPEVALPDSVSFDDAQGFNRTKTRIKWWNNRVGDIESMLFLSDKVYNRHKLNQLEIESLPGYASDNPLVFFGHYWVQGEPVVMSDNVVCLDFSVAKNGYLTAYRWDGEPLADPANFVFVAS